MWPPSVTEREGGWGGRERERGETDRERERERESYSRSLRTHTRAQATNKQEDPIGITISQRNRLGHLPSFGPVI